MTPFASGDLLERLSSEVRECTLCALSQTRKNVVAGEGPRSPDIMFIGEAPGRREDSVGKPFVGSAGKILDAALSKAGIDRSGVFITNVVKCRPPNNRRPTSKERLACSGHLERQILILSPKIICILGSTAYHSLLGGKSIIADRGKVVKRNGIRFFLTVHPASVIYNKSLLTDLENDMLSLATEVRAGRRIDKKTTTRRNKKQPPPRKIGSNRA
ncbi:MAG TPA: uracil-DNA glycosylase [Nitrososphaeraceae archaeon]|nr:uracil-DNA glycosylase [Nitrososphaeraceae archaeon]